MGTAEQWVSSICTECGAPVDFELGAVQVRCAHCDAGLVVDQGQRLVRLVCPGCGGNFYYLDGSMSGHCPFCQASLLAVSRNRVLRFVIPPAAGAPADAPDAALVLLPFWHLSGLIFGWNIGSKVTIEENPRGDVATTSEGSVPIPAVTRRDSGPKKRFMGRVADLSIADPSAEAFGVVGLRWRAALFPMEPFGEQHERLGRVVPSTSSIDDVRGRLHGRAMTVGSQVEGMTRLDCQRQDLVSEELALYYYPFWVHRAVGGELRLWDGVTGDPEPTSVPGPVPTLSSQASVFDDLSVILLQCKSCGGPLTAGNRSVVLPCSQCGQFWLVERDHLQSFPAHWATAEQAESGGTRAWLPFWRVPARVRFRGREATTVIELVQQLGVVRPPVTSEPEPPTSPLHYYVPAYGAMRAPRLDHAARDMTRSQPRLTEGAAGSGGEVFHCFFGPEDARKLAYVTWIQVLPSALGHQVRSLRLEPGAATLWYVPFEQKGREMINLVTGQRYERSTFRGVRH